MTCLGGDNPPDPKIASTFNRLREAATPNEKCSQRERKKVAGARMHEPFLSAFKILKGCVRRKRWRGPSVKLSRA